MAIQHELVNNLTVRPVLITAVADNTAQVGAIIDTQGYEHVTFAIATATITTAAATFAVTMDHGNAANLSDAAPVDVACLVGTFASAAFNGNDDNATRKIGYTPGKGAGRRYVRITVTPTGNAAAANFAVVALLMPLNRAAGAV